MTGLRITSFAGSHPGLVRRNNEDSFYAGDDDGRLTDGYAVEAIRLWNDRPRETPDAWEFDPDGERVRFSVGVDGLRGDELTDVRILRHLLPPEPQVPAEVVIAAALRRPIEPALRLPPISSPLDRRLAA